MITSQKTKNKFALITSLLLLTSGLARAGAIHIENGLTREFSVKPGAKVESSIVIMNSSSEPQQVKVYQVDYSFKADGKTLYGNPGSLPRSNCTWMTVAPKQLNIPGNSSASAYFTINVPDKTNLTGTYWSVIMVEPVAEGSLEPPKQGQGKVAVGIKTVMRYAIQVVANIGDTGNRAIQIVHKEILTDNAGHILALDVENTGERWLRPSIKVEIYDEKGILVGRFDGNRIRIYPGCSQRSSVKLGRLEAGKYTALVLIDNGDDSVWGAQYELEIK